MLYDIKTNFMVRTPMHLLESKIYSTFQNPDESVKEFGAKLADLQNMISNRIKDKFHLIHVTNYFCGHIQTLSPHQPLIFH